MKCIFLLFNARWSQAKVTDTQVNRANTIGSQHRSAQFNQYLYSKILTLYLYFKIIFFPDQ